MSVLLILLYAVCLLLLTIYLGFRWQYRHILATATKLPCPPTLPIIGNALFIFGDITYPVIGRMIIILVHQSESMTTGECKEIRPMTLFLSQKIKENVTKNLLKVAKEYNGIFCIWIGPVPIFVIVDAADAQVILNSSSTLERDNVYSVFKIFLGNSLLSAPVHIWKRYRKLINPVLHPSNVEHFLPVFNEVGRKLTERFSVSSSPSDRTDDVFDMALDASLSTVIPGKNHINDEMKTGIKYLFDSIGRIFTSRVFKVWLYMDWLFNLVYWQELKKAQKIADKNINFIDQILKEEEILRKEIIPDVNLSNGRLSGINLMDIIYENLPLIAEDHDWRDEVTTLIAGASDTVVSCLNFLLFTLGNHSEIQDKIFMEIQDVMGDLDRDITAADVNAMTYIGQVILESLRLHGNVIGILRKTTKDTKLPSCTLPAGSRMLVMLYSLGWNEEQFPKPEQFLPDRFSPDKQKERHKYSFLPFSAGPRNCIGKAYAMMVIKTVLVHILRRLRVTSHSKLSEIEYELKVVMYSKTPLLVSFHPR